MIDTASFDFAAAASRARPVVRRTPLQFNARLSGKYRCSVYLKREDLQEVRSYKIRGAYNLISSLTPEQCARGVVCASAGNHAQGFAYTCHVMDIQGVVFMPVITPRQKVEQVAMFGEGRVEIRLVGDTFDDCAQEALAYTEATGKIFIPPFNHPKIIEGQGTMGIEILEDLPRVDYLFMPVGGGGLASGLGIFFREKSPSTRLIGAEPLGAPSMLKAFEAGHPVRLAEIDSFVDGAALRQTGELTFSICREVLDELRLVPEGRVCSTILRLYNENGIVVEPAGALSIAALDDFAEAIAGQTVVCIVSGSNNDIDRMQEIKERALLYEGLKHYFIISFAQRPGALKEFVNEVLGPGDDITRFEYMQKHNKESGPALVGVELQKREDYHRLIQRLQACHFAFTEINRDDQLFGYLV